MTQIPFLKACTLNYFVMFIAPVTLWRVVENAYKKEERIPVRAERDRGILLATLVVLVIGIVFAVLVFELVYLFAGDSCPAMTSPNPYTFICPVGYEIDELGFHCNDVDECTIHENLCKGACVNTIGSYDCECLPPFECDVGYALDNKSKCCLEIDECAVNNGGCMETCVNTVASFQCGCTNPKHRLLEDGRSCYGVPLGFEEYQGIRYGYAAEFNGTETNVETIRDCASLCSTEDDCVLYQYSSEAKECRILLGFNSCVAMKFTAAYTITFNTSFIACDDLSFYVS
ncbi:hypothetical protein CAPTEDRAFT_196604 [Capitella teleta]|uniref:Apple domain-containing protein n=1 Tax=Capitella teleta TaxID=283909 RepID=R7U7K0_CAPTE|nr:hypothetical protein CAPTEDRAFT_196604 [Capitella teleta]|eukprot:ELU02121.1 hypothetical protein CAPTEDRAFT_196604 [Capitella teleta]